MEEFKFYCLIVGFFCMVCLCFIGYGEYEKNVIKKANEEERVRVENCIDEGYLLYYNGTRVGKETVCVFDYKYTIDDEKKSIYLTDAEKIRRVWFPFVVY